MNIYRTIDEWEAFIGSELRAYRLFKNIEQATLAENAGISRRALQNLESGKGSTLNTLIRVVRALDRTSWFHTIAPAGPTINPLFLVRDRDYRVRASSRRKNKSGAGE